MFIVCILFLVMIFFIFYDRDVEGVGDICVVWNVNNYVMVIFECEVSIV